MKKLEARSAGGKLPAGSQFGNRHGDAKPNRMKRNTETPPKGRQLDIPFEQPPPSKRSGAKPRTKRVVRESALHPDPVIYSPKKFLDPTHERISAAVAVGDISNLRPLDLFDFIKRFERLNTHLEKVIRISDGYQTQLREATLRMERLARMDPLTGLSNRRDIQERLERELSMFRRYGTPFSLILFDVDNFKNVNDSFGHDAGDEALRTLARVFGTRLRDTDSCGRWGGEEFIVICSATQPEEALVVAEKCRKEFAETSMDKRDASLRITISGGVCGSTEGVGSDELLKRADEALYRAKEAGKNTVLLWSSR